MIELSDRELGVILHTVSKGSTTQRPPTARVARRWRWCEWFAKAVPCERLSAKYWSE